MHRVQGISEQLMVYLARGLSFADDFFAKYHDIKRPSSQSTLCLLQHETPKSNNGIIRHRAGAHIN
jgi:isopenicillin N synthase-like dioxygenase